MITNANKVERDLAAWRKQEEQIIQLFPPSVVNSREFRLEKLGGWMRFIKACTLRQP